jgi:hypothetical protein
MTEQVFWPNEEATQQQDKINVTIVAWDYEQKRGTAMLPGGQIAEVRQITALTVVTTEEDGAR